MKGEERLPWLERDLLSDINSLKLERIAQGHDIIDLAMINPDLPPARFLLDKLLEASVRPANHRYAVARGIRKLREAFAEKYQARWDVRLDPESQICVTMGAKDALEHTLMALAADGDEVLVGAPAYPAFISAIGLARLVPVYFTISSDEDQMLRDIEERAKGSRVKVVLLNFPNNPTGATVSASFYERLIELARRLELFVINDFTYGEMQFDGTAAPSLLEAPDAVRSAVEIYSLSKAYSIPGWRVGAVLGNAAMIRRLSQLKAHIDYGTFLPIQHAASAALTQGNDIPSNVTAHYAERFEIASRGLQRLGWEVSQAAAGCSVWARLPVHVRAAGALEMTRRLLTDTGVVGLPGPAFGGPKKEEPHELPFDEWIRFALVAPPSSLRQMIERLAEWSRVTAAGRAAPTALALMMTVLLSFGVIHAAAAEQDCVSASASVKQGIERADGSEQEAGLYRDAIAKCPGMAEAHYSLGVVLDKQGKRDEAIAEIQKAIELNDQPAFRVALGSLFVAAGKFEDAKQQFDHVVDADPKNISASQGLALLAEKQGDVDHAIEVLEKARDVDPRNALTQYNLGVLYQRKNQDELALQAFEKAAQLNPKDFDTMLYEGLTYERLGRPAEAVKTLEKAAAINPSDARVHEAIGVVQERLGDLDKAELAYRKAVSIDPSASSPSLKLAAVLVAKKQESLAEELLKRVTANDPKSSEAFTLLGWSELQLGKVAEAEKDLQHAIELDAANAAAHNNLGVLYQRQGKRDEAKREFNAALAINPQLESARRNLADAS